MMCNICDAQMAKIMYVDYIAAELRPNPLHQGIPNTSYGRTNPVLSQCSCDTLSFRHLKNVRYMTHCLIKLNPFELYEGRSVSMVTDSKYELPRFLKQA